MRCLEQFITKYTNFKLSILHTVLLIFNRYSPHPCWDAGPFSPQLIGQYMVVVKYTWFSLFFHDTPALLKLKSGAELHTVHWPCPQPDWLYYSVIDKKVTVVASCRWTRRIPSFFFTSAVPPYTNRNTLFSYFLAFSVLSLPVEIFYNSHVVSLGKKCYYQDAGCNMILNKGGTLAVHSIKILQDLKT